MLSSFDNISVHHRLIVHGHEIWNTNNKTCPVLAWLEVKFICRHKNNWGERERASHSRVGWRIFDMYVYIYVRYVRDSVYLYDLFKRCPASGLGTRSTATRPGYEAWVRFRGALMS